MKCGNPKLSHDEMILINYFLQTSTKLLHFLLNFVVVVVVVAAHVL